MSEATAPARDIAGAELMRPSAKLAFDPRPKRANRRAAVLADRGTSRSVRVPQDKRACR
jgi:hypothetical protein